MKKIIAVFVLSIFTQYSFCQDTPKLMLDSHGHSSVIYDLVYMSSQNMLISGSWDKTIRFWDIEKGALAKTVHLWQADGPLGQVIALALSPNNKFLAVSIIGIDKTVFKVHILNLENDSLVAVLTGQKGIIADLTFTKDGKYIVGSTVGSEYSVYFWKSPTKLENTIQNIFYSNCIKNAHNKDIYSIAISSDMTKLVTTSYDSTFKIWNLPKDFEKGKIDTLNVIHIKKHTDQVRSCDISNNGKYIATGGQDKNIYLWDINGNLAAQFRNAGKIGVIRFAPDSKKLLAFNAGDSEVDADFVPNMATVYSVPDGRVISTFSKHKDASIAACFIDSVNVATASWNVADIYIWNISTRQIAKHFSSMGKCIYGLGWADGFNVALGYENTDKFTETTLSKSFNFDGFQLNDVSDELKFKQARWDYNGKRLYSKSGFSPTGEIVNDTVYEMYTYSYLNDGSVLVSSATNYDITYYSKTYQKVRQFLGHGTNVWGIAISPDEKYMISAGVDQVVKLWSLSDSGVFPNFQEVYSDPSWVDFCTNNGLTAEATSRSKECWSKIIDTLAKRGYVNAAQRVRKTLDEAIPSVIPLVNLFIGSDNEWICWTPNGYFTCSPNGDKYFGWHINRGFDRTALFYPASQLFEKYYRPDIVSTVIKSGLQDHIVAMQLEKNIQNISQNLLGVPEVKIGLPTNLRGFLAVKLRELTTDLSELTINLEVKDNGAGISEIRLYQNNKLITSIKGDEIKPKFDFKLSLANGKNEIKAIALNSRRIESIPDNLLVTKEGTAKACNLYLLAVGIDSYMNRSYNLNYAVSDANAFVNQVNSGSKGLFGVRETSTIINNLATKDAIISKFNEIKKKITKDDVFIFYYAGHGTMGESLQGAQPEFYIVPCDITQITNSTMLADKGLSSEELMKLSMNIPAQKQMFILDACQSGGAVDKISIRGFAEEKAIMQLARSAGFHLIAASGSEQFATEVKELGHGIFTYSLIEGLSGKADGGLLDKKVTVFELSSFLNDRVPDLSVEYKGQPQYPKVFSKGDDFPIVLVK